VIQQLQIKDISMLLFIYIKQFIDAFSGFPNEKTLTRFMNNLRNDLMVNFRITFKNKINRFKRSSIVSGKF
jgi:hypothetical protein